MNLKFLSWNVRGLNDVDKRLQVRNLLRSWKADIVCLQETKLEWITRGTVWSIWSCPYVDWLYLGSDGASGGILLMWDSRVVEKVEEAMGHFSVSCKFKNVGDHFEWAFTGVCGPNLNKRHRLMWEELTGLISLWDLPWCVGGDFIIIRFPSERLGAASFSRAMFGFSDFISLHGLMDIPMAGGLYTWSNSSSASRLDRFLFTPLLLAALKLDLKKWNETEFGNVTFKKQELWSKLNVLDAKEKTHGLTAEEKSVQVNLHTEIEKLTLLEEISWRQKSRVLHLKEGDANTKFFHRMANSNRKNNGIESLMTVRPFPDVLVFPMISAANADWLERPFEEAEIFDVVQSFNGDKSPGPDGFPMAFFQSY
nr:uncharacterized protein LOC112006527 [Quercus suber]